MRRIRPPAPSRRPVVNRSSRGRRKPVDRLRWRRKIRSRPRLMAVYKVVVAVAGVGLMILAVAIGWLPGPGGFPLFIAGMAVLTTEFVWANHLLRRTNRSARRLAAVIARQPVWVRRTGIGVLIAVILIGIWMMLAIAGLPGWLPALLRVPLDALPGVDVVAS